MAYVRFIWSRNGICIYSFFGKLEVWISSLLSHVTRSLSPCMVGEASVMIYPQFSWSLAIIIHLKQMVVDFENNKGKFYQALKARLFGRWWRPRFSKGLRRMPCHVVLSFEHIHLYLVRTVGILRPFQRLLCGCVWDSVWMRSDKGVTLFVLGNFSWSGALMGLLQQVSWGSMHLKEMTTNELVLVPYK